MSDRAVSRVLKAYPRSWRELHGDALVGMLEESAIDRPDQKQQEYRHAIRLGVAMRTKQLLPYVLAVGGLGSAAVALTLIVTAFTSQNAPVIQVLMFGLSPLLSFVAVITALRPAKDLWGVASLGSAGIIAACAAHMSWYTLIDAESPTGATFAWPLLITTAVLLIAGAGALFLWRSLAQKVSQKVAIAMSILVGMVSGGVIVPVLATPGAAPTIAIAVLVVIAVLHRREIRAMRQRAPLET